MQPIIATCNVYIANNDANSMKIIQKFYNELRYTEEYAGLTFSELFMLSGAHQNPKKENRGHDLAISKKNYK